MGRILTDCCWKEEQMDGEREVTSYLANDYLEGSVGANEPVLFNSIPMKKYLFTALVLSLLAFSSLAFARDPVSGIDVRITNSESGTVTTTRTDATGKFSVALDEGTYTVCISEEECAHAIKTKGTGTTGKSHGSYVQAVASRFAVEIGHAEGISVKELLSESPSAVSKGVAPVGVITFSSRWTKTKPGLAVAVTGLKKEFVGHVVIMKG
jgi:hypothetical protein